jgi:superfamily II DNA helicase RecQ
MLTSKNTFQAATTIFLTLTETLAATRRLKAVIIDEFHLAERWEGFRPDYKWLLLLRKFKDVAWLFLSATASPRTVEHIMETYRVLSWTTIRVSARAHVII